MTLFAFRFGQIPPIVFNHWYKDPDDPNASTASFECGLFSTPDLYSSTSKEQIYVPLCAKLQQVVALENSK